MAEAEGQAQVYLHVPRLHCTSHLPGPTSLWQWEAATCQGGVPTLGCNEELPEARHSKLQNVLPCPTQGQGRRHGQRRDPAFVRTVG